jgi:hypothetical protein
MGDRRKVKEMNYRRLFIILLRTFLLFGVIVALQSPDNVLAQTPTPFLITPYFGQAALTQGYHAGHQALDFGLSYQRVLAASSGIVDRVQWWNNNCHQFWNPGGDNLNCAFGLHLRIDHGNGYRTWYAHHSSVAFNLGTTSSYAGQGQIVGTSGHTGYSSGPHLHFQTQRFVNGIWTNVNPENPCLWQDGHRINICNPNQPSHPIPEPPTNGEIIVDDNDNNTAGFSKGRSAPFTIPCPPNGCPFWYPATAGYGNDMYFTFVNGNIADYWARWQPGGVPAGGSIYEIFVHVPNINGTTWQAPYTIVHGLGQTTAVVDQFGLHNQWVSIGAYYLRPGDYVYTTEEGQGVHCGAGQWCQLGVDAVKFVRLGTTHIPLIQTDSGWTSSIITRSNGGDARFSFRYYSHNGTPLCGGASVVPARGTIVLPSCSGAVSAVLDSTQDVAVAVLTTHASPFSSAAYVGVTKPSTEVMLPLVHRHNYGWNSLLHIQNARSTTNNVTISFRSGPAGSDCTQSYTLSSLATLTLDTTSSRLNCLGDRFVGTARITAWYPVAAAYTHYTPDYISMIALQGSGTPSGSLFAPLIQNNNYSYNSGFSLQNAAGGNANLSATYYLSTGSAVCLTTYSNVAPYRAVIQNPSPPAGCTTSPILAAKFGSSAGPLAAQVNQFVTGTQQWSGYPAVAQPTNTGVVPRVFGNGNGWITGIQVQNAGSAAATITVNYYNSAGVFHNHQTATIQPNTAQTFFVSGHSFVGSALVRANQPIAVAVNHLGSGGGDILMSHIGVNH